MIIKISTYQGILWLIIIPIFAETAFKHEETKPHTHEDIRKIAIPDAGYNASGVFHAKL
jgi:hypothetical protein